MHYSFVFLESFPERFIGHLVKTRDVHYGTSDATKDHMRFYFPVSDIKLAGKTKSTFINMIVRHSEMRLQHSFSHP